jgi:integrase
LHLTAIDDFYRHLGLGAAAAKRQPLPATAPRALETKDLTKLLRSAERATARDRALAFTELYAGLRGGEAVALDTTDLRLSARKGTRIVRHGKGGRTAKSPCTPNSAKPSTHG